MTGMPGRRPGGRNPAARPGIAAKKKDGTATPGQAAGAVRCDSVLPTLTNSPRRRLNYEFIFWLITVIL